MSVAIELLERRIADMQDELDKARESLNEYGTRLANRTAIAHGAIRENDRLSAELRHLRVEAADLARRLEAANTEIGKLAGRILDLTAERDKLLAEIGELFQLHACQRKTIEEYQTVELEKAAAPVPHIKHITIRYRGDLTHDILAKLLS